MRSPGNVDHAILHQQRRSLGLSMRFKRYLVRTVGMAWELSLHHHRTAELLAATSDVDGVHFVHVHTILLSFGDQIHCLRREIDGGCAGDSDFRDQVIATYVAAGDDINSLSGIDEAHLPERRGICTGIVVSVEGIEAVMFGGEVDNALHTLTRDTHVGYV